METLNPQPSLIAGARSSVDEAHYLCVSRPLMWINERQGYGYKHLAKIAEQTEGPRSTLVSVLVSVRLRPHRFAEDRETR